MPNIPGQADHAAPTGRPPWPARARKFLVGAAGLAGQVAASGALDAPEQNTTRLWVQAFLALATAAGIYATPNARA